jgi:hypothetical protein
VYCLLRMLARATQPVPPASLRLACVGIFVCIASSFSSLCHNAGDYVVALAQLDRLACPKPLFQASGITQLAQIDGEVGMSIM